MRKSIRIARLIRRRRFRYRRMHAWRLDLLAVVLLFGAGWLLLPPINSSDGPIPVSVKQGRLSVVEKPLLDRDEAVLSPAMFAFTAPEGFAYGVVATQLSQLGGQIPLIPSSPLRLYSVSAAEGFQDSSSTELEQIASFEMPPPPLFPVNAGSNIVFAGETAVYVSIPGIVPKGHFRATVENSTGKSVRITVHFGAEGRADSAVLFSHALDAADAARVERAAMRLAGPPNTSAWIVLSPGD